MSEYNFFVYCPDRGFEIFETLDEALDEAEERIHRYIDDYWSEEVTSVRVGKITHRATMCDQIFPEGEIDEDGLDEAGECWESDMDYKCNYKMLPVEPTCPTCRGGGWDIDYQNRFRPVICPDCAGSGKLEHSITAQESDSVAPDVIESTGVLNEIKAKAIEEAVSECMLGSDDVMVKAKAAQMMHYANKLRG